MTRFDFVYWYPCTYLLVQIQIALRNNTRCLCTRTCKTVVTFLLDALLKTDLKYMFVRSRNSFCCILVHHFSKTNHYDVAKDIHCNIIQDRFIRRHLNLAHISDCVKAFILTCKYSASFSVIEPKDVLQINYNSLHLKYHNTAVWAATYIQQIQKIWQRLQIQMYAINHSETLHA